MGFRAKLSAKVTWVSTFLLLFFSPKMAKTQMAGCSLQGLGLEQCLNQGKNSISIDQSCCIVLNQVVQAGFHCLCLLLASHNPPLSTPLVFPLSSNCFISAPPLTQCQALVPVLQPPVAPLQPPVTPALQPPVPPALPVLLPPDTPQEPPGTPALPVLTPPHFPQEPPVTPALPVLLPPDIPQEPPQPPAPNAFLLPPPPPPPPQELPLKSTSDKNSTTPAMQPSLNNNSAPDLSTFKTGYFLISEGHKKTISFQSRLSIAATLCACMI